MPGNLSETFHHIPLGESKRSSNLSKGHFTVLVKTNYQELHFTDDPWAPSYRVGRVRDLRLMMEPSGANRGYAYIRYYTPEVSTPTLETTSPALSRPTPIASHQR
jgi:hypothetical protein